MTVKSRLHKLILLFFTFLSVDAFCQDLDSLINFSNTTKDKKLKSEALLKLTTSCPVVDIEKYALPLIDLSDELIQEDPSNKNIYLANKAQALNDLGFMYKKQGLINQGTENFYKSVKISESIQDTLGMADTYANIANCLYQQGDKKVAISFFEKSLNLYSALNDEEGKGIIYNNLGQIFEHEDKYELAISYYEKCKAIWGKLEHSKYQGYVLNNIGVNLDELGYSDSALSNFNQALKIFEDENSQEDIAWTFNLIGRSYLETGDYKIANEYLEKGYKLAVELREMQTTSEIAENLYLVNRNQKNYKEAYNYYRIFVRLSDSIHNESTQKSAIEQQTKYEYEKQKALNDANHEKQLAIEQEAKEKQTIITYAAAGGLGLVGIFLLFAFNRLKITRKQKNIIENAHEQLEEKNQEILDSINYAKRIQSAILPPHKVVKEYLQQSFIMYKPKDIVAGDFYWLEQVGDKVLFAAADCTGHGVPGAMVSVVCNNGLNRSVREHGLTDPGKILDKTREIVVQEFEKSEEEVKDGMDIALCVLDGNTLHYAGAHNPLWIIRSNADEIEEIKADKQPIGKTDNPTPYTTHKIDLKPGDTLYIFSDGYADQFGGEKGKKLKSGNFKKLLLSIKDQNMQTQHSRIEESFENWKGGLEQLDDVCVIGVRI